MKSRSVCIIIPAYNEEGSIAKVVRSIKKIDRHFSIIVVNDGSSDATAEIAKKEATKVINLPFNLGIGGSVQTGLKYANENGFDIAIQVDGDEQHNPKFIPKLLKSLNGNIDMVIGSRYLKSTKNKSPFMRTLGNKIFSKLINLACGQKIFDTTSGYRVFSKKAISFFANYYPIEFPEPRSIVVFLKSGYKIKEIPVEMRRRTSGKSSVTPLRAVYFMLSISLAIILESIKARDLIYE